MRSVRLLDNASGTTVGTATRAWKSEHDFYIKFASSGGTVQLQASATGDAADWVDIPGFSFTADNAVRAFPVAEGVHIRASLTGGSDVSVHMA